MSRNETLVLHRFTFDGEGRPYLNVDLNLARKVGDTVVLWNAAPGYGRAVYRVTRVDLDGVWGRLVDDTRSVDD